MSSEPSTFPSPVGGIPLSNDFAPSVLFAVLHGLLVPVLIYRLVNPKSRTFALIISSVPSAIERVVTLSLRAAQARGTLNPTSDGLLKYMQVVLGISYLTSAADLAKLLQCLLVAATQPQPQPQLSSPSSINLTQLSEDRGEHSLEAAHSVEQDEPKDEPEVVDERERERWWYRTVGGLMAWFGFIPSVIGIIAGQDYPKVEHDSGKAESIQRLRYVTVIMTFIYVLAIQGVAIWSIFCVRRVIKSSAMIIVSLAALLNVISIYRLIVMRCQTTSLTSLEPGSLNNASSKATFYIFQIAPEFLVTAGVLGINVKERFKTGLWGDIQFKKTKK